MIKLKIGVLMGGKSQEREVSFNSGRTVCDHLDATRYEIIPIFQTQAGLLYILPWHFLHRGKTSDFEHRIEKEAQKISWSSLKQQIDFAYIAMHGRYAEDGTLQSMLELLHIPYLGSKRFASALCMDKSMTNKMLRAHNIAVPHGILITPHQIALAKNSDQLVADISLLLKQAHLEFPLIVKPHAEGSSLGVSVAFTMDELIPAIMKASEVQPHLKQSVLVEEKIEGLEFSCIVITDYHTGKPLPLPPTEIVTEKNSHVYDYEQKYMPGRALEFTPARGGDEQNKKIQETCIAVMQALEMSNVVRIDGFVTKTGEIIIVDPNTITGMAPSSFLFREAAEIGMSQDRLINHLIETELHQDKVFDMHLKNVEVHHNKTALNRIKVAVLFGGQSNEREISLESGRNVYYKLSREKYEPIPVFISHDMQPYIISERLLLRHATQEISYELDDSMLIKWDDLALKADFVFIALHGGAGENGTIQGAFEMLSIPYNGSGVFTSSLCMDKFKTSQFLKAQGFDTPSSELISRASWENSQESTLKKISQQFSFPYIIKPHDDGCSVFVSKINNEQEARRALETIFNNNKQYALIEEFISGMELTVGVIGNNKPQALPPSQAVVKEDILSIQEKFLPGAGENQTPAPLPKSTLSFIKETLEAAYIALGCKGYVRIDCFYQSNKQSPTGAERVIILEVNSLPALTPATCLFHQAAEIGLKPIEFIDTIVKLGLENHGKTMPISLDSMSNQVNV